MPEDRPSTGDALTILEKWQEAPDVFALLPRSTQERLEKTWKLYGIKFGDKDRSAEGVFRQERFHFVSKSEDDPVPGKPPAPAASEKKPEVDFFGDSNAPVEHAPARVSGSNDSLAQAPAANLMNLFDFDDEPAPAPVQSTGGGQDDFNPFGGPAAPAAGTSTTLGGSDFPDFFTDAPSQPSSAPAPPAFDPFGGSAAPVPVASPSPPAFDPFGQGASPAPPQAPAVSSGFDPFTAAAMDQPRLVTTPPTRVSGGGGRVSGTMGGGGRNSGFGAGAGGPGAGAGEFDPFGDLSPTDPFAPASASPFPAATPSPPVAPTGTQFMNSSPPPVQPTALAPPQQTAPIQQQQQQRTSAGFDPFTANYTMPSMGSPLPQQVSPPIQPMPSMGSPLPQQASPPIQPAGGGFDFFGGTGSPQQPPAPIAQPAPVAASNNTGFDDPFGGFSSSAATGFPSMAPPISTGVAPPMSGGMPSFLPPSDGIIPPAPAPGATVPPTSTTKPDDLFSDFNF